MWFRTQDKQALKFEAAGLSEKHLRALSLETTKGLSQEIQHCEERLNRLSQEVSKALNKEIPGCASRREEVSRKPKTSNQPNCECSRNKITQKPSNKFSCVQSNKRASEEELPPSLRTINLHSCYSVTDFKHTVDESTQVVVGDTNDDCLSCMKYDNQHKVSISKTKKGTGKIRNNAKAKGETSKPQRYQNVQKACRDKNGKNSRSKYRPLKARTKRKGKTKKVKGSKFQDVKRSELKSRKSAKPKETLKSVKQTEMDTYQALKQLKTTKPESCQELQLIQNCQGEANPYLHSKFIAKNPYTSYFNSLQESITNNQQNPFLDEPFEERPYFHIEPIDTKPISFNIVDFTDVQENTQQTSFLNDLTLYNSDFPNSIEYKTSEEVKNPFLCSCPFPDAEKPNGSTSCIYGYYSQLRTTIVESKPDYRPCSFPMSVSPVTSIVASLSNLIITNEDKHCSVPKDIEPCRQNFQMEKPVRERSLNERFGSTNDIIDKIGSIREKLSQGSKIMLNLDKLCKRENTAGKPKTTHREKRPETKTPSVKQYRTSTRKKVILKENNEKSNSVTFTFYYKMFVFIIVLLVMLYYD